MRGNTLYFYAVIYLKFAKKGTVNTVTKHNENGLYLATQAYA